MNPPKTSPLALVILLAAAQLAFAAEPQKPALNLTKTVNETPVTLLSFAESEALVVYETVTLGPGIKINCKTGEVTLPKAMTLPEAAVQFWAAVAKAYPYIADAMRASTASTLPVEWTREERTTYEFGLRADGVVVWRKREAKP
jgi:hypothetical protein